MGALWGPKVRIGEVGGSPLSGRMDQRLALGLPDERDEAGDLPFVNLDMPELLQGLSVGMPVSLSDGMLQFDVVEVR